MKFSKPKAGLRAPRGQIIKNIQTKLQMPVVDGVFGNDTDKAVRHWQKDNSLSVTGVVDDNFDIAVRNGGLDSGELDTIRQQEAKSESALLKIVAEVVADHTRPKYRQDVLSRKMTLATGSGTVHGDQYDISGWGIG